MLNVDTSFVRFRYPSATLPPGSWAKILFPSALITPHSVRQRKGQLVRLGIAQADRQAALRVSVDQQDFLSGLRQPDSQVGTGHCHCQPERALCASGTCLAPTGAGAEKRWQDNDLCQLGNRAGAGRKESPADRRRPARQPDDQLRQSPAGQVALYAVGRYGAYPDG